MLDDLLKRGYGSIEYDADDPEDDITTSEQGAIDAIKSSTGNKP